MDWFTQFESSHWFVLALVLLIAELSTGTTYLLWPAVAAGVTGLASLFFNLPILQEIALFATLTIALTAIGRPLLRSRLFATAEGAHTLNERDKSLIGARGVAAAAFLGGVGSVKLGDTVWRATCADSIAAGQAVEVLSVEGATVSVKPVG